MKNLKNFIVNESVVTIDDADFDTSYKGEDKHKPIEMKLKFIPIVEYCYFIDYDGAVMDWINSNDEPDETVGSQGTFYFKCTFVPENKLSHINNIEIWSVIETNFRGDITSIKMNRSGVNRYSPIGFNELADLLYNVGHEYAIGYFEDKDAIIEAFNNCKLYI